MTTHRNAERLLRQLEAVYTRCLKLSEGLAHVLAVWTISTYFWDAMTFFPYLAIISAVKRSGKSTLLEILAYFCRNAIYTADLTEAALFHLVTTKQPTLLIDEAEMLSGSASGRGQALRSILNTGYKQGATVQRVVGGEIREYRTYGPKAIALIGSLTDTVMDRSLIIRMTRARQGEVEPFFPERAADLAAEIATWANEERQLKNVDTAYRRLRQQKYFDLRRVMSQRDADIAEPLLAVQHVVDPNRVHELTNTLIRLSKEKAKQEKVAPAVRLLADLREILTKYGSIHGNGLKVATEYLLYELYKMPDERWRGLTSTKLAQMLQPFGIEPIEIGPWQGKKNVRGYLRTDIIAAADLYAPDEAA